MRIGWDLDGVTYDFSGHYREWLLATGYPKWRVAPLPTRWEFYKDWGISTQEFGASCDEAVDCGFLFKAGPPMSGAANAMDRLVAAGHEIHIITDRTFGAPGAAQKATLEWLLRWDLPFHNITFTADKAKVPVDWMIDDRLENYDMMDAAGVKSYLINRAWNQAPGERRRVDTLREFADIVLQEGLVHPPMSGLSL